MLGKSFSRISYLSLILHVLLARLVFFPLASANRTPSPESNDNLASLDLKDIVGERESLIKKLVSQKLKFEAENTNGTFDSTIKQISERIRRLQLLEDVIKESLETYASIVKKQNTSNLDAAMDAESTQIIEKFQKLVVKAKNDQLLSEENKKVVKHPTDAVADTSNPSASPANQNEHDDQDATQIAAHIVGDVLKDVAEKADNLEKDLKDDSFSQGQNTHGAKIETVIKVDEATGNGETNRHDNTTTPAPHDNAAPVLIDSANNRYVLSKAGDATALQEDSRLLNDILILLMTCFAAVFVMQIIRLPHFFGYVIAGMILGPTGFIKNSVQVETIARGLGVIFIMFFLGLEFNMNKIRKVWLVSLFGSAILLAATVFIFWSIGYQLGGKHSEAILVGEGIFLSSTIVVLSFLKPEDLDRPYGRAIMGILVAQDVLLGFLLVIMPAMEQSGTDALYSCLKLILYLGAFCLMAILIRYPFLQILQWILKTCGSHDVFLMGCICFCLVIIELGARLNQSMELCCFIAGVMVASRKALGEATMKATESLKDVFSALFFASIGLHIYPSFIINEGVLLLSLTAIAIIFKIVLCTTILYLVFRQTLRTSFTIAVGLGQISEFTIVLASKAKSAGIMSRETFYLLVGVTILSMTMSPLIWRLSALIDKRHSQFERIPLVSPHPEENLEQVLVSFNAPRDKDSYDENNAESSSRIRKARRNTSSSSLSSTSSTHFSNDEVMDNRMS